jgi:hypothetical protein
MSQGVDAMTPGACPRYDACVYLKKSEECLQNNGGDCYTWFIGEDAE